MTLITKILVANRGEIAVRIFRAAHDAGINSVAVYADQDRNARFVKLANEAYALNGANPTDSYLVPEKIIAIAKRSGANAIHPGYGFLSEDAEFAQLVLDSGLIWIGPSPASIRLLGDKVSARKIAQQVGAPLAPGTTDPVSTPEEIIAFAEEHGLPVAIKAANGGGGRGLRVAYSLEEIPEQFAAARREATAAFGRGDCFVEKFLSAPRHVETQCLADRLGNVVVISTRDCSVQRRHQKVLEEAPAPFLTVEQDELLRDASKAILRAASYTSAGTCEFLIGADGVISFLEVNTRLQVEHPVSEEISGIDLVREQFRLAEGGTLDYGDPPTTGHSIEFRINGEDAGRNFLPTAGPITLARFPGGPGVRIDSGVTTGDLVTGAFDSLLAKLIVTGVDREDALSRARRALEELEVRGIPTLVPLHRLLVDHPDFAATNRREFRVHTNWLEAESDLQVDPWDGSLDETVESPEIYRSLVVEAEGRRIRVGVPAGIFAAGEKANLKRPPERANNSATPAASSDIVICPMQATVTRIAGSIGQKVAAGEILFVVEAMKMEQPIVASRSGHVAEILVQLGETVPQGQVLAVLK